MKEISICLRNPFFLASVAIAKEDPFLPFVSSELCAQCSALFLPFAFSACLPVSSSTCTQHLTSPIAPGTDFSALQDHPVRRRFRGSLYHGLRLLTSAYPWLQTCHHYVAVIVINDKLKSCNIAFNSF